MVLNDNACCVLSPCQGSSDGLAGFSLSCGRPATPVSLLRVSLPPGCHGIGVEPDKHPLSLQCTGFPQLQGLGANPSWDVQRDKENKHQGV